MKYGLLFLSLFFSHLSFASSTPQNRVEIFETDEKCEVRASFMKFENTPNIFLELQDSELSSVRLLALKIMTSEREIFHTIDNKLPSLEVRMTLKYESSLPLLSVFYSGRYFSCTLNHKFSDDPFSNVGSIGH